MSITWKYTNNNMNGIIDIIYCSHVQISIPIHYFWTVLLKNKKEYDLTNPILKNILTHHEDLEAFKIAKENYMKLIL
jgi:hypothetical protein